MESTKQTRLLSEFPPHTEAQWKEAAVQLLKGRPFEKTLVTPTYEGFSLQPVYTREGMRELPQLTDQPGAGSRVRGSRVEGYLEAGWRVSQELTASTPEAFNKLALEELECGQNELNIWLDQPTRTGRDADRKVDSVGVCGLSLSTLKDVESLLVGIHPEMISLYFQSGTAGPALCALLEAWTRKTGTPGASLSGCLGIDPVGWLAESGSFYGQPEAVFSVVAELMQFSAKTMPSLQVLDVQGHPYHNAGASSVQEMAAILATGVTYIREMSERGIAPETVVSRMRLSVSIGGNYFIELSKLRALRLLWNRVMDSFGIPEEARRMHVHARTGQWNKTRFDPYVNMLRTTTEAFSAVVGGCDSLHVSAFDEGIRESDAFSRRIARNTHAILAEECGMTQVIDPAGGSWAVETLTDDMAREAWKSFQEIEAEGGIVTSLKKGRLQEAVEAVRSEKAKNIQRRKDLIVGTNAYPNATEKLLPLRKIDYDAMQKNRIAAVVDWKTSRDSASVSKALQRVGAATSGERMEALVEAAIAGATLEELQHSLNYGESDFQIQPLLLKRASAEFEVLRLAARALKEAGTPALIHQLNMGPSRRYRIRADWTSSFFQVGGLEVLNEEDFTDNESALTSLKASRSRVAVITSDDETYAAQVEPLARAVKKLDPGIKVIVAGAPGEQEASWRDAGVDDFVHVRVNNYTFNRGLLESMGAAL